MKKKYIAPYSKEIKLDELMDDSATLPTASQGENHTVDAKRMGWGDESYEALPDNSGKGLWDQWHTNLWDNMMWK